ncbi:hypothetical protein BO78DRAFT_387086 [Aspergillus sclerotiicarbonarius CBS 121057]|uniref:Thioredoxin-like fold domain-containing protein n=1 Tax=Aspergillus sclerotiicarbonarius (strain CBS 121057 / IBT 28362) TaxID=1448318 RepID=A0A319EEU8_ASPSB|nr:hypothetical protein BO78DRAFT_387086 [Aspergillus sclerotiicarbonarius CBS 121057]
MYRVARLLRKTHIAFRISPPLPRDSKSAPVRYLQIKRPWVRRVIATILLSGAALHTWSSFVVLRFDETLYDTDVSPDRLPGADAPTPAGKFDSNVYAPPGSDVDAQTHFIPMGWPRLCEGELYAATDPEWQAFRRIASDRNTLPGLKDELVLLVLDAASQSSLLSHMLGGPLSVAKFWLEHRFPYRAPPAYYRSGLQISQIGFSWSSKPMSAEDGDRLQRWTRPLVVAHAIKDAFSVLWSRQLSRFSTSSDEEQTIESPISLRDNSLSSGLRGLDGLNDLSQSVSEPPPPSSQEGTSLTRNGSRPHPSVYLSTLQRLPLPNLGPGSDLHMALLAFKWRLNYCWARSIRTSRRGVMYISGPVGIRGPNGICRVEVKGEYDVMASRWTVVSMDIRDLNLFNQRALGSHQRSSETFHASHVTDDDHSEVYHVLDTDVLYPLTDTLLVIQDLDYVCPFSAKLFNTFYTSVKPIIIQKYQQNLQVIFRQHIQPWHPSSTLTHEAGAAVLKIAPDKFWEFSAALFSHQKEFFDVSVVNETRNKTYERLAKIAATVGVDEHEMIDLLRISEAIGDGQLNSGNKVTNDIKLMVKSDRVIGVHVSPTVYFNGVEEPNISSSFTATQWEQWLAMNVA